MSGAAATPAGARSLPRAGWWLAAVLVAAGCAPRGQDTGGAARASGPTRRHVSMHAVRFDPASLEIAVGDTVEWDNHDLVPHTSTALNGAWFSGNIGPDSSWSTVIRAAGTLAYTCSYHTQMKGQLVAK